MRAKIIQEKPKCFFLFSSKKNLGVRLTEVFLSSKTGQLKKVFLKSEKKKSGIYLKTLIGRCQNPE